MQDNTAITLQDHASPATRHAQSALQEPTQIALNAMTAGF